MESAGAARLAGRQRGPTADAQVASRLDDLRRARQAQQDRVARGGEAAILSARDRFLDDADRRPQGLARQRGQATLLQDLQGLLDGAPRSVQALNDLRDAVRRVREPVVPPPQ